VSTEPGGLNEGPGGPADFFVSYTRVDLGWAEWIAWQLEDAGYRVFLQAWDFVPGSHWTARMQSGILHAGRTLAVVSHAYLASVYGAAEWQAAYHADPEGFTRKLVPVRVEDSPRPGLLRNVVSFDLFGLTAPDAKRWLLDQIAVVMAGRAKPSTEPLFPGAGDTVTAAAGPADGDRVRAPGEIEPAPLAGFHRPQHERPPTAPTFPPDHTSDAPALHGMDWAVNDTRRTIEKDNIEALASAGISRVFRSRIEASDSMVSSMRDDATTELRLMGISLGDLVHPGSRSSLTAGWSRIEDRLRHGNDNSGPLQVRVLLAAPGSTGTRLLGIGAQWHATGTADWHLPRVPDSLDQVILAVAWQLRRLAAAVPQTSETSFELRFYRSIPQFFLCATNKSTYVHPYYLPSGERVLDPVVMSFSAEAARHRAAQRHFDVIWSHGSVPADEVLVSSLLGIEPGMAQSGGSEVFVDPESVRKRVVELLHGARRRVWIQAMTLEAFRSSPIDREMEEIARRAGLDVRLVVLDPTGETAFTKTFHEYLLLHPGATVKDYRRDKQAHRNTRMYHSIEASIVWFQQLAQRSSGSLRLHKSNFSSNMFLLIVDDVALVEQYHYGKAPGVAPDAMVPMLLAEEMPTLEYHDPGTTLFNRQATLDPLQVIESHFLFMFDHLSLPVR
jgi:hypothetical protein